MSPTERRAPLLKGATLRLTALCGQISPCAAAGESPPRLSRNDGEGKSTDLSTSPPLAKGGTDCDSKPSGDLPLRNKAGLSESSISKTPTAYRWGQILQPHCVRQRLARRKENASLGHRSGDMMPSLISHGKTAHKCCFENSVLVFAKGSLLWSTALCGQISPGASVRL